MTIRSAVYLAGNKYLLWDDIKGYLQDGKRTVLVEAFYGSGTIALNAVKENMFEQYIGNDSAEWLIGLHEAMKKPEFCMQCSHINRNFTEDAAGFAEMVKYYNKDLTQYDVLYNLMCRSNSNRTRFSGSGSNKKYNMSYGKRARFDLERLIRNQVLSQDIELHNTSFAVFLSKLEKLLVKGKTLKDTTVYLDSPYFQTTACYNENGGWTNQEDMVLLGYLLKLQEGCAKVVYSNVFFNKGKHNTWLIDWCEQHKDKFDVIHLDRDYSNSSSFKYSGKGTDEVLIVSK